MADPSSIHLTFGRGRRRVQLRIKCVPQHPSKLLVETETSDRHRVDIRVLGHENLRVERNVDQASDGAEIRLAKPGAPVTA